MILRSTSFSRRFVVEEREIVGCLPMIGESMRREIRAPAKTRRGAAVTGARWAWARKAPIDAIAACDSATAEECGEFAGRAVVVAQHRVGVREVRCRPTSASSCPLPSGSPRCRPRAPRARCRRSA